jgi:hypothetical protein
MMADGIFGNDSIKVHAGDLLGEIAIASAIHDAKSMVVLTHVKGHIQAVLGGALKNISCAGPKIETKMFLISLKESASKKLRKVIDYPPAGRPIPRIFSLPCCVLKQGSVEL